MPLRLEKKITRIKNEIARLADMAEQRVEDAIRAALGRDEELARRVAGSDREVDDLEVEIEERCLASLALEQPVAMDLRFIIAALKINNDLERIADLAVGIAEQAIALCNLGARREVPFDLAGECDKVREMLRMSIEALMLLDQAKAERIMAMDDEVDRIHAAMYELVRAAIEEDPSRTAELLRFLSISRSLERIADHVTNIAEDICYTVRGDIHRHNPEGR